MQGEKVYPKQFWLGIKHEIPLCCILFFESAWHGTIKKQIAEYAETMDKLTDNQGVILCPDCLAEKITGFVLRSELA